MIYNEKIDCRELVQKLKSNHQKELTAQALSQCEAAELLWEKCVLLKVYTSPQSTKSEEIIKKDLKILKPLNNVSGDGHKNGVNYEIKVSIHDKKANVNIRQIRPHHNIDYYIIVSFNMDDGEYGTSYIFKIPSKTLYSWIPEYGGYTHGTVERNGEITENTVSDVNVDYEYSLTANPNGTKTSKQFKLWELIREYEVDYNESNF